MTTSKTSVLAVCLFSVLSGAVMAETSSPFSKIKPMSPIGATANAKAPNYLGASMGSTTTDGFCDGFRACDNSDKSWKAFAGVRVNDNIVVEGGYVDFGKQTGSHTSGDISQQATAFTTAAVAGIPMNEQIEIFGKAGIARWTLEKTDSSGTTENTGTDVLVGVGADYNLGDNMGVRAEWERFKDVGSTADHSGDIDMMSLGFIFSSL
ncbi:Outer membrane protein beta-barrel domain-containing protein [Thiothrix caldifontis]|uniref:Outer membrane protein beta-barrel domain-containing protein n=1 Tax=Thiothrix caldifontis TaxID=525918 RepID=A0A1H3YMQ6_9GAMM|nr:outer membrane beta-barrel protein [Thiothrix caldifontis]SEA12318.1 Outer membrane protein beta-barrel domain-containing protein [Thiothrix caldifontis]